jgi:hypothetical protein
MSVTAKTSIPTIDNIYYLSTWYGYSYGGLKYGGGFGGPTPPEL